MLKLFKRTRRATVHFCERCSRVYTSTCRRDAVRTQAIAAGMRYL